MLSFGSIYALCVKKYNIYICDNICIVMDVCLTISVCQVKFRFANIHLCGKNTAVLINYKYIGIIVNSVNSTFVFEYSS